MKDKLITIDESAFVADMLKCTKALTALACGMLSDKDDAADAVQTTFMKALEAFRLGRYQPVTNLRAWLYTITYNNCINQLRRKQKIGFIDLDTVPTSISFEWSTEDAYGSKQYMTMIYGTINQMPERIKEARLLQLQGFKYDEIAEQLEVPIGTVKTCLHRSRCALKEAIERLQHSELYTVAC